jgi:uncharacterized repeat protein (TIGR01451 family)
VGLNSGSAYIFQRNQGGADNWGQVQKVSGTDSAGNDYFGSSVSIHGDTVIAGANGDNEAGNSSGSAYIFERNQGGADNWGQVQKIVPDDGNTNGNFGWAVTMSSNTAVVGAIGSDDAGNFSGAAYIFERNQGGAENWGQVQKLVPADAAADDYFGSSASISNDKVIIGAHLDDDVGSDSGSAYVYYMQAGPDLAVDKDDGVLAAQTGSTVTYTLSFTNTGVITATGVTLTETVPAYSSFNAAASTPGWLCLPDGSPSSTCILNVGSLPGEGTIGQALFFAIDIDSAFPPGPLGITNTVLIGDDGANGADLNPADNEAKHFTPVDGPPVITTLLLSPEAINENDTTDLSLTFDDIGILESHSVVIDWGDGLTNTLVLITGTTTITAGHRYLDDAPAGFYAVSVTVNELDGDSDSAGAVITVNNVNPTWIDLTITPTVIFLNDPITLTGVFTDPGTLDTHIATVDWGDGTIEGGTVDDVQNVFSGTHIYAGGGTYTITVSLVDDDGGETTGSIVVQIKATIFLIYLPAVSKP